MIYQTAGFIGGVYCALNNEPISAYSFYLPTISSYGLTYAHSLAKDKDHRFAKQEAHKVTLDTLVFTFMGYCVGAAMR